MNHWVQFPVMQKEMKVLSQNKSLGRSCVFSDSLTKKNVALAVNYWLKKQKQQNLNGLGIMSDIQKIGKNMHASALYGEGLKLYFVCLYCSAVPYLEPHF